MAAAPRVAAYSLRGGRPAPASGDDASESYSMTHILVTGASGGIGAAICKALAVRCVTVVLHYHSDRAAAEATQQGRFECAQPIAGQSTRTAGHLRLRRRPRLGVDTESRSSGAGQGSPGRPATGTGRNP